MKNAACTANDPRICPRPTPCRNSSPVSSLRFWTNSRSINAITAIPPPNPMLPILRKAARRRSREMRFLSDRAEGADGGRLILLLGAREPPASFAKRSRVRFAPDHSRGLALYGARTRGIGRSYYEGSPRIRDTPHSRPDAFRPLHSPRVAVRNPRSPKAGRGHLGNSPDGVPC